MDDSRCRYTQTLFFRISRYGQCKDRCVENHLFSRQLVNVLKAIDYNDKKFFRKGLWGQGKCHLHICEINSAEWHEKLLFRNYLRQYSGVAAAYVSLKQQLAVTYHFDRPTYTKKKEPFIRHVINTAHFLSARV